jgi:hypothetical protein
MATYQQLDIDDKLYGEYAQMLREVLLKLGAPKGTCQYTCHYKMGPNGPEDYFTVSVEIRACKEVPELLLFTTCEAESIVTSVVQYASWSALRFVTCERGPAEVSCIAYLFSFFAYVFIMHIKKYNTKR